MLGISFCKIDIYFHISYSLALSFTIYKWQYICLVWKDQTCHQYAEQVSVAVTL
jgi:hypothetical protein